MRVEDAQAPGRHHQQRGHREHDADAGDRDGKTIDRAQTRRHRLGVAEQAGVEERHDRARQRDPRERDPRRQRHQQREAGGGEARRVLAAPRRDQLRVERDERRRQRLLAEQVLHHVGTAEDGDEDVAEGGDAEEVRRHPLAQEPGDPAQQDAGGDLRRAAAAHPLGRSSGAPVTALAVAGGRAAPRPRPRRRGRRRASRGRGRCGARALAASSEDRCARVGPGRADVELGRPPPAARCRRAAADSAVDPDRSARRTRPAWRNGASARRTTTSAPSSAPGSIASRRRARAADATAAASSGGGADGRLGCRGGAGADLSGAAKASGRVATAALDDSACVELRGPRTRRAAAAALRRAAGRSLAATLTRDGLALAGAGRAVGRAATTASRARPLRRPRPRGRSTTVAVPATRRASDPKPSAVPDRESRSDPVSARIRPRHRIDTGHGLLTRVARPR